LITAKDGAKRKTKSGLKNRGGGGDFSGPSDIFKLVKMILERRYDPVIISFSKRECEAYALQISIIIIASPRASKPRRPARPAI
jgi:ATP-dependent RNA helicase DOB1